MKDAVIAKLSGTTGAQVWAKNYGLPEDPSFNGDSRSLKDIAADSAGNIFVTGGFVGTTNPGCGVLNAPSSERMLVVKYAP